MKVYPIDKTCIYGYDLCMKIILFLLLSNFFLFAPSIVQADDYEHYLAQYSQIIRHSTSQNDCINEISNRLQSKIDNADNFNEKAKIPNSMVKKWGMIRPSAIEKDAASQVISICSMPIEELRYMAKNYDYGRNSVTQNTDMAISIYYYMYFAHEDVEALYRLKDLGENVVTKPQTKEEQKALEQRIKELKKEIKEHNINTNETEEFLMNHIPVFSSHLE